MVVRLLRQIDAAQTTKHIVSFTIDSHRVIGYTARGAVNSGRTMFQLRAKMRNVKASKANPASESRTDKQAV